MNRFGTLDTWPLRIFLPNDSLLSSTSTRTKLLCSSPRSFCAYSTWAAAMGISRTCTGASQVGNTPP